MTPRQRRSQALTLLLSVATAGALGAALYVSVTALPYLTAPSSSDPTFGDLNQCLSQALREPVGFAVAPSADRVAAWSTTTLVECSRDGGAVHWPKAPRAGSYDLQGRLYVLSGDEVLLTGSDGGLSSLGGGKLVALAGLSDGVVVLEEGGRLIALESRGVVAASTQLPVAPQANVQLVVSPGASRVVVRVGSRVFVYDAPQLRALVDQVPCSLGDVWFSDERTLGVRCQQSIAMRLEVDTGAQRSFEGPIPQPGSVRVGSRFIIGCGGLPCIANEKR